MAYEILSAAQARSLASPLRQEIVDVLESIGPSTIADVAARLNRRPDTLYFHVRSLARVGLLKEVGVRGAGRKEAAVYDLPGRPLRLVYGRTPKERLHRVGPALDSILRLARRDTRRALANPETITAGTGRDLWVARARGWLTPAEVKRATALLDQLFQLVHTSAPRKGTKPVSLAFALTPLSR